MTSGPVPPLTDRPGTRPGVREIIDRFGLEPLPGEGGFYARTHRSSKMISREALPPGYEGPRPFSTAILYLLTPETFSALHRLPAEEVFHFHLGDPVRMLNLHPGGRAETVILGPDVAAGQQVQWVVPKGVWQGCRLKAGGDYALLGTTMAPGFDWPDLELADPDELIRAYPQYADQIRRLAPLDRRA